MPSGAVYNLFPPLQVISMPGYTLEEKVEIASQHLLPKQMEVGEGGPAMFTAVPLLLPTSPQQHGLTPNQLILPSSSLKIIGNPLPPHTHTPVLHCLLSFSCRLHKGSWSEESGEEHRERV